MEEKYLLVKEKLKKYDQEQLLANYEKLNEENKNKLLDEILQLDIEQINNLYKNIKNEENKPNKIIEPISFIEKDKLSNEEKEKYEKIGKEIIKNGQYAVITMAGGQRNKARAQSDQKELLILV